MTLKGKGAIKHLLLQGIYDHRVNQGIWLSLATLILLLIFYLIGLAHYAFIPVLAVLPALIGGVDKPSPHFSSRLLGVESLFFCCSILVILSRRLGVPEAVVFFPLIFCFAMFAAYGERSGRVGTGAMVVATLSLSWPEENPFYLFPLLIGVGTLWYGIFSRFWIHWWGHHLLRDTLAKLFIEIGEYYVLKADLLQRKPSRQQLTDVLVQQEKVYGLVSQSKHYFNRYGEKHYNRELKVLERDFLFGVDLMEQLQANQCNIDRIRELLGAVGVAPLYTDFAASLVAALKRKAFAVKTRRWEDMDLDTQIERLQETILGHKEERPALVHFLTGQFTKIGSLLATQQPAFKRSLGVPARLPGFAKAIRPHLNFRSSVFRYSLRLSVTVTCGIILANSLALEKYYWMILAILFVMQSGYLMTKTLITQRVLGTIGGVLFGLMLISLPLSDWSLLTLAVLLGVFSFSMVFIHKVWSIFGVTALVVVAFQLVFAEGQDIVFVRLIDTLLGCGLAFVSNLLLWPQWHGGGVKRLLRETLETQEDILTMCVRSLSDRTIGYEQLTRRRLKLFTAQNNLLASYQQMLREPQHTRQYVESLDRVLIHFVAASSHINSLLSLSRNVPPMKRELTDQLERMITALFDRCDKESGGEADGVEVEEGMEVVHESFARMREEDNRSVQYGVAHLLDLIFERLSAIFDILDFCDSQVSNNHFHVDEDPEYGT
ncbi:MAG: FUSC family membrane protein [Thermodesulfobacteriota bacterium]